MAQKKKLKQQNFQGQRARIGWRKVPRKGRGVFALDPISKGEIVEIAPVVPVGKKHVPEDAPPDGWVLDWDDDVPGKEYAMALGYIMLYNHSEDPNIELESDLAENTVTVVAIRDIPAGQELLWDYGCEIWFKKH